MFKLIFCLVLLLILSSYALSAEINDPTRPLWLTKPQAVDKKQSKSTAEGAKNTVFEQRLVLQSVFYSDKKRLAVINGNLYKEGDLLAGYIVMNITKDKVAISRHNKEKYLYLFEVDRPIVNKVINKVDKSEI